MGKIGYNIGYIFRKEMRAVFRDEAVLTFFVALTLLYPLLYTCIYNNETVHEVPVAVVDYCNSSDSRELVRRWDASSGVQVKARCQDIQEAKDLLYKKEIYGILEIPSDFASSLLRGEQAHVSLFCDMGGLLNYKALLQAATEVTLQMGREVQVKEVEYASIERQLQTAAPVQIEEVKMFNPQSGYASFIIPAILILVLQQSLLLGVGTLAGTARERSRYGLSIPLNSHYNCAFCIVCGKALAYLPVYLFVGVWIYIVVPGIFNLTHIGQKWDLFLFLFPFLLGSIFFAITLSFLCKERVMPFLLFVFTSVPLMFISGISWPVQAIPSYWKALSKLFPSTFGIEGYTRINNMGASVSEVEMPWKGLWILLFIYFALACLLYYQEIRKKKKVENHS